MEAIEILVIIAACLIVTGVLFGSIIKRHKNKNNGCVGGCCGCPHSKQCASAQNKESDKAHDNNKKN